MVISIPSLNLILPNRTLMKEKPVGTLKRLNMRPLLIRMFARWCRARISLLLSRRYCQMSRIFLQSRRLGWTLRRLTLIYKFLVTFYLDKTAERTRMVVELLFMLKIPTRLLLSQNCPQFLIVTFNSSGLRYSVKSLNPSFCVQFIGPQIRLSPSLNT